MVMKPFCVANLKMPDLKSTEESKGGAPKFTKIALFDEATKQCRVLFMATTRLA
jgi:hypothetical protein